MFGFVLGAIVGSAATYVWYDKIRSYMRERVPDVRDRAADQLGVLGERAGSALDRARSRIDESVRTGQQKLRTAGGGTSRAGDRGASTSTPGE